MSIKFKIISGVLLATLIPFTTISLFVYNDLRTSVEKQVSERIDSLATIQKARTIDIANDYKGQIQSFTTRLQLRQELDKFNKTGSKTALAKINQIIAEAKKGSTDIVDISILNRSGVVVAATDATQVGHTEYGQEYFQKGNDAFDTTVFFKKNGQVYVYLVGPLYLDNKKVGVAAITGSTKRLFDLFKNYGGLGTTGTWALAQKLPNGDGLIIVPGRLDTIVPKNSGVPLIQAVSGNERLFENIVNYRGEHVISATRYIPELEWGISVNQNRQEAFATVNSLVENLLFYGILLVILVIILSTAIAQMIIAPINSLYAAANKVAAGDLSVTAKVHTRDEIGKLASVFNEMVARVRESQLSQEKELDKKEKDFVSLASHQLLSPLALISGYVSMIISGKIGNVDSEAKQYLEESLSGAHRMSDLVKSLLTTARIESGDLKLAIIDFDLYSLVRNVVKELYPKLTAKKLTMHIPPEETLGITADKEQTRQVVTNVIENAIKYTDRGNITVSFGTEKNRGYVTIVDTGIGIDAKTLPHIFEKFYMSENWLSKQAESYGLGLYISRLLLTLMGGTITVDSKKGKGSLFKISLPLAKDYGQNTTDRR